MKCCPVLDAHYILVEAAEKALGLIRRLSESNHGGIPIDDFVAVQVLLEAALARVEKAAPPRGSAQREEAPAPPCKEP